MKKNYKPDGLDYDTILKNRFTAYVEMALIRNQLRYYEKYTQRMENEVSYEFDNDETNTQLQQVESIDAVSTQELKMDEIDNLKLFKALKQISNDDLTIVKLHVLYGLSFSAIANSLGVTCAVVSSRYYRAVKKIRRSMEEQQ